MTAKTRIRLEDEVFRDLREFAALGYWHKAKCLRVTSAIFTILVNWNERQKERWGMPIDESLDGPEEVARRNGIHFYRIPVIPDCERLELVF